MATTSSATTSRPGGWPNMLKRTMTKHPELVCFTAAIIFSICSNMCQSTVSSSKRVERNAALPTRFFAASSVSHVLDYPYGQIGDVGDILNQEGVLAVMFYAPWCAQSRRVRKEYQLAAKYLSSQVKFVSVNCWYVHGQCRKTNQFLAFPVIYFYHRNLDGYKYAGPLLAEHIIQFIEQLMYPLSYISSPETLAAFLGHNERSVIGYFDMSASPSSPEYMQFHYAAMRTIEKDPRNVIRFAVVTSKAMATRLKFHSIGEVMYTQFLNNSIKYPTNNNFTSSAITQWLFSVAQQPSSLWLLPTGSKSLVLSSFINKGPAMIMFTPYFPLSGLHQTSTVLHEVALSYYSCGNLTRTTDLLSSLDYAYWESLVRRYDLLDTCAELRRQEKSSVPPLSSSRRNCCMSVSPPTPGFCDLCLSLEQSHPLYHQSCPYFSTANITNNGQYPQHSCRNVRPTYHPSQSMSLCCPPLPRTIHSQQRRKTDDFVDKALRRKCQKLTLMRSHKLIPPLESGEPNPNVGKNIKGMGCQTNRTLKFYTMDSRQSSMFSDKLGMENNGVVIIDTKAEVQHVVNGPVTKQTIVDMIANYTADTLDPFRRSTQRRPENKQCSDSACVVEVTTDTFNQIVMDEEKDVVLMYYTPWCGFCAGFAHIYLSLAKYFRNTNRIVFARINAACNDLPWQYTVDAYPSIIMFPAHRKSESVSFPDSLKLRTPSLLRFILTYAAPDLKLESAVATCTQSCVTANTIAAARTIHTQKFEKRRTLRALQDIEEYRYRDEDWFEEQREYFKSKLRRIESVEQSARQLHGVLRSDQRLEKHKLAAIRRTGQI